MTRTLKCAAILAIAMLCRENGNAEWKKTPAPEKPYGLKQRPVEVADAGWRRPTQEETNSVLYDGGRPSTERTESTRSDAPRPDAPKQAEKINDDPPPVPQGEPGGCVDMYVVDRVTNQEVQRSKWKDFFQNTSYVHITANNMEAVPAYIQDGRPVVYADGTIGNSIGKNICSGGSITFSYRRIKMSKKDSDYVVLRSVIYGNRLRPVYSYSIPLFLPRTNTFYWDNNDRDTVPSVREFQNDANFKGLDEIRDAHIERRVCEERVGYSWRYSSRYGCRYYRDYRYDRDRYRRSGGTHRSGTYRSPGTYRDSTYPLYGDGRGRRTVVYGAGVSIGFGK